MIDLADTEAVKCIDKKSEESRTEECTEGKDFKIVIKKVANAKFENLKEEITTKKRAVETKSVEKEENKDLKIGFMKTVDTTSDELVSNSTDCNNLMANLKTEKCIDKKMEKRETEEAFEAEEQKD